MTRHACPHFLLYIYMQFGSDFPNYCEQNSVNSTALPGFVENDEPQQQHSVMDFMTLFLCFSNEKTAIKTTFINRCYRVCAKNYRFECRPRKHLIISSSFSLIIAYFRLRLKHNINLLWRQKVEAIILQRMRTEMKRSAILPFYKYFKSIKFDVQLKLDVSLHTN